MKTVISDGYLSATRKFEALCYACCCKFIFTGYAAYVYVTDINAKTEQEKYTLRVDCPQCKQPVSMKSWAEIKD